VFFSTLEFFDDVFGRYECVKFIERKEALMGWSCRWYHEISDCFSEFNAVLGGEFNAVLGGVEP
jgi:hypothetical protein